MRNVLDKSCTENQNTHVVFSNFFFSENRTIYEIMWENMVEPERPQMTVQYDACALHARQIRLDTLKICNTYDAHQSYFHTYIVLYKPASNFESREMQVMTLHHTFCYNYKIHIHTYKIHILFLLEMCIIILNYSIWYFRYFIY